MNAVFENLDTGINSEKFYIHFTGGFTFIPNICPGSISDKEIVVRRVSLNSNLWEQDEIVAGDRGFLIEITLSNLD